MAITQKNIGVFHMIEKYKDEKKISDHKLAMILGVDSSTISNWRTGKHGISEKNADKIRSVVHPIPLKLKKPVSETVTTMNNFIKELEKIKTDCIRKANGKDEVQMVLQVTLANFTQDLIEIAKGHA